MFVLQNAVGIRDSDATEIENILFNDVIYPCFSLFLIINILMYAVTP